MRLLGTHQKSDVDMCTQVLELEGWGGGGGGVGEPMYSMIVQPAQRSVN